jgi:heterodisulfide reductase subunit D
VDVQVQLGQDVWDALILDEIDRARAGGADTLATIYHGCQRLVCGFEAQRPITIEHYLSVFARGLGIEFEDRYKKFRLWQDPERVLEESTPCQTANYVDPARARQLVEKTFGRISTGSDPKSPAAS